MKLKRFIALVLTLALTLSLGLVPTAAVVEGAADENTVKLVYPLAKRVTVGKAGTATLNAYASLDDLSERIDILFDMLDKTKPIIVDIKNTNGAIMLRESFVLEGPDKNFSSNKIFYEFDYLIIESNTFPDVPGTISVSGTVEHYFTKSSELAQKYQVYYDSYGYRQNPGINIYVNESDAVNYSIISNFVPVNTSEVIVPYRAGPNGTNDGAPRDILEWIARYSLPKAKFIRGTFDGEYDPEASDLEFWKSQKSLMTLFETIWSELIPEEIEYYNYLKSLFADPENFAYEVMKKNPDGSISIDPTRMANNNYPNVYAVLNDNIASYDGVRVTIYNATDNVITPEYLKANMSWVETNFVNPTGMYATGTMGAGKGSPNYKYNYGQALFNNYGSDPSGNVPFDPGIFYYGQPNVAYNLFYGALILNSPYTMQQIDTQAFTYNANSITFDIADIKANLYTSVNSYLNMLHTMHLATTIDYYYDSIQFEFYNVSNADDELVEDDDGFYEDEPVDFE
jgi:hypothetical protein